MHTVMREKNSPVRNRLREIIRESPELKDAAVLYEAILPLLHDADLRVGMITMTSGEARLKLEQGLPLLSGLDLELDVDAARDLMIGLAAAVEKAAKRSGVSRLRFSWPPLSAGADSAAARIRSALEKGELNAASLLSHAAEGVHGSITATAEDLKLDPMLLLALSKTTLKPALRAWCRQMTPVAGSVAWPRGTCFVCGAAAAFGELRDNDQASHLRCGTCGADWRVPRMQCMSCGNEDHSALPVLYDEIRRERMRVEACESCRGYLKVISSFSPTPIELIEAEDLSTLPLDYIARAAGFRRPDERTGHAGAESQSAR